MERTTIDYSIVGSNFLNFDNFCRKRETDKRRKIQKSLSVTDEENCQQELGCPTNDSTGDGDNAQRNTNTDTNTISVCYR